MRARKLMLWIFLVSDAAIFLSLLAGYAVARSAAPQWPDSARILPIPYAWTMTAALAAGSVAAVLAVRRNSRALLSLAAVLGAIFLAMQAGEWIRLIAAGAGLSVNPWGVPQFGAWFFILTGFHGAHVLVGVIWLGIVSAKRASGRPALDLAALYWHFVDGLWFLVFSAIYLF